MNQKHLRPKNQKFKKGNETQRRPSSTRLSSLLIYPSVSNTLLKVIKGRRVTQR